MIWIIVGLGTFGFVMGVVCRLLYTALKECDKDWDYAADQWLTWEDRTWSANRRRKRVERYLRRSQRKNDALALANAELRDRLRKAESRNEALAADLAEALLHQEDNASVREKLLRKIR